MQKPYADVSFWFDSLDGVSEPDLPDLPGETDVAIVGGGFTGLWTAYYLKRKSPELDISVFEAETVGYGASGRNGGWCMGEAYGIDALLADPDKVEAGVRLQREMFETVDEVGRVCQAENIDCHFAKGGWLTVARMPFHVPILKARVAAKHAAGFSDDDYRWLPGEEAGERFSLAREHGAIYGTNCAAVHPARLVRGLGAVVRRLGVAVYERSAATALAPGVVTTERGPVKARIVLRATEGYTASIDGHRRDLMPLYSMVTATEPLPEEVWAKIGLHERELFGDPRRLVIYGQRTLDDRLVLGGRAGYYFGSRRRPTIPRTDRNVRHVESVVRGLFPELDGYRITHGWGGLMGMSRHSRPCVSFDARTGMGWAGGYVGEGVAATNLAARVLSDLVLDRNTELTRLEWVEDVQRRWEIEPVRWLGAHSMRFVGARADAAEARTGRPSRFWGRCFDALKG